MKVKAIDLCILKEVPDLAPEILPSLLEKTIMKMNWKNANLLWKKIITFHAERLISINLLINSSIIRVQVLYYVCILSVQ